MRAVVDDAQFDLVDLSGVSIADLATMADGVFAHSLQRIFEEI